MQLRTAQGIRDAEKEIAATVNKEQQRIGKKIEAVVQWGSFTDHAKYTALSLDDKTALLRSIQYQHIDNIYTGSNGHVEPLLSFLPPYSYFPSLKQFRKEF
jgi:hypothetical protein